MIEKPVGEWKCPSHSAHFDEEDEEDDNGQVVNKKSILVPEEAMTLDFFPYDIIEDTSHTLTNRRNKRAPLRSVKVTNIPESISKEKKIKQREIQHAHANPGFLCALVTGCSNIKPQIRSR
jgi:hypothetical protein